MDRPLKPLDLAILVGDELLLPGVTVRDFWAWALGDLRLNANRGMLAQFLVARAVGDDRLRDEGWANFDVLCPDGTRIEVKSSGYLQSWNQNRLSAITFSGLWGRSWSAETGNWSLEPTDRADVFVFAVHACMDHAVYDPLDLNSWQFHVVSARTIYAMRQKTISLKRLLKIQGVVSTDWAGLAEAVQVARIPG